jgi:hypothetical protein
VRRETAKSFDEGDSADQGAAELIAYLTSDPMLADEFLDIHDRISTPWFRVRMFLRECWQRLWIAVANAFQ